MKNKDGSTTKAVTDTKTGAVTETTTYPDGTKIVATTPEGGKASIYRKFGGRLRISRLPVPHKCDFLNVQKL